jgi:hypothetical protein
VGVGGWGGCAGGWGRGLREEGEVCLESRGEAGGEESGEVEGGEVESGVKQVVWASA